LFDTVKLVIDMFNVPDGLYRLAPAHVPILSELFTESFNSDNEFWQSAEVPTEEFKKFFEDLVRSHLQAQDELMAKLGTDFNLNMVNRLNIQVIIRNG
jgi:hypothetical protein